MENQINYVEIKGTVTKLFAPRQGTSYPAKVVIENITEFENKNGEIVEMKTRPSFIIWNELGHEFCDDVKIGDIVSVTGMVRTGSYKSKKFFDENNDPATIYTTDIEIKAYTVG